MFCVKCGKEISDKNALFCPFCGEKNENSLPSKSMKYGSSKSKKFIFVGATFVFLLIFILSVNSSNSYKRKIIGSWKCDRSFNFVFYDDGAVEFGAVRGIYDIKGNTLTVHSLSSWYGDSIDKYKISFKGKNTLIMTDEGGWKYIYYRDSE